MILLIGVIRMSEHPLTSEVGIGSKSHDLEGDNFSNFENVIFRYRLERR